MHVCAIVAAMPRPIVSCIAQLSSESQQREIVIANGISCEVVIVIH